MAYSKGKSNKWSRYYIKNKPYRDAYSTYARRKKKLRKYQEELANEYIIDRKERLIKLIGNLIDKQKESVETLKKLKPNKDFPIL